MNVTVLKFGGSSLCDAAALKRVSGIVEYKHKQEKTAPLLVVSAMGDTTDRLQAILDAVALGDEAAAKSEAAHIAHEHRRALELLQLQEDDARRCGEVVDGAVDRLERVIDGMLLLGEITERSRDAVLAVGETISAPVVAATLRTHGLNARFVPADQVIVTDSTYGAAHPEVPTIDARCTEVLLPLIREGVVPVVPGFVGDCAGVTTTLGRGGSDLTASLIARALSASALEYWKDVDGILSADPGMVEGAVPVPRLTFREAAELAFLGARVLHPASIQPAVERGIPVRVFNTYKPQGSGTAISARTAEDAGSPIRSVAYKRKQTLVNIHSTRMLGASGFLRRVFEVFDRLELPVDHIATSEVNITVTISDTEKVEQLQRELGEVAGVQLLPEMAIVSVVGEELQDTSGVCARIFAALRDVNVRLVTYGGLGVNLSVVVHEDDLHDAVRALHREFFEN